MIVYIIALYLIGGIFLFFDGFGSLPKKSKKKRLVLLISVIIAIAIGLGVCIMVTEPPTTANTMINAFHNDRELFEAVVGELEKYSGLLCVYCDKDDIHYPEHNVVEMGPCILHRKES